MPSDSYCVIETEALVGGYGSSIVLRDVCLRVRPGVIYALLGPNGAGKTTLMRMLLGILTRTSGKIRLFGKPLEASLPGILQRIGTLIEEPSLYGHLSGIENLEVVRILKGLPASSVRRAVEMLKIETFAGERVSRYSRGMRQRLGLAAAFLGPPDLLVLDEPMNGVDVEAVESIREALQCLSREQGTTIFMSSHQFEEVEKLGGHLGILTSTGDLVFQGQQRELHNRLPRRLSIGVDDVERAVRIIKDAAFPAIVSKNRLVITEASDEIAREVNCALVSNGIRVHHLALEPVTLEALFRKVIHTVKPWQRR